MNRLELLAFYAKDSKVLCDIGCDHAYALIRAITNYNVDRGIAADVARGPLDNAIKTIKQNKLENKIEAILSDGFDSINYDFDCAIISGMGGILICDILKRGISKLNNTKLIIEANSDSSVVRDFLFKNGFKIIDENALFDQGKYYEIIVAINGESIYDEYDILYGPILRRTQNDAFVKHYNYEINLLREVISKMNDGIRKEEKKRKLFELVDLLRYKKMEKHYILNTKNYYRTYFLDEVKRPTIVIAPGGGYQYTSERESGPVAAAFNQMGYHAIVVNYRETTEEAYPMPGVYLCEAINEVSKDNRVGKLIGIGFSAGGHCILELVLHKEKYNLQRPLELLILAYPVVTADYSYAHLGSFQNLLIDECSNEELRNYLSLEKQVTKDNVIDLFLWGTITDESVVVQNSLSLIEAYNKVGGNVEYHMFPFGGHGLSVANELTSDGNPQKDSPYIARWISFVEEWLKLKLS